MSYFVGEVGKVKIQELMQEEFGHLYHEEYDQLTDPFLVDFSDWFLSTDYVFEPIHKWSHWDMKPEWIGKYQMNYEDGILTYGVYWNVESPMNQFYSEFLDKILPYIMEQQLEIDNYEEVEY